MARSRWFAKGKALIELDEALTRFQLGELEYGPGLANHGPMAAEALLRLGHGALMTGFVDRYAPRILPLQPGRPILEGANDANEAWSAALGQPTRASDWVAHFEKDLSSQPWQDVLVRSVERLQAGLFAGAGHGWLRVAHAVRALEEEDTKTRRRELAHGLAYWAARYQLLPGEPGAAARPGLSLADVLLSLEPVPARRRRPGLFFDSARVLDREPSFAAAIGAADPDAEPPEAAIGHLCRVAVRLYLSFPEQRVAYVHVVTVPSALRLVARRLPPRLVAALLARAFQAVAALHAISAAVERPSGVDSLEGAVDDEVRALAEAPDELRYRAACSLDEHAIKMAEACLREDALTPDRGLRLAAADAALRLPAPGGGRC